MLGRIDASRCEVERLAVRASDGVPQGRSTEVVQRSAFLEDGN
jgi:hypothetical protein